MAENALSLAAGSSSGALTAVTERDRGAVERGSHPGQRDSVQKARATFGYVPPAQEDPFAPSLRTVSGKFVPQEGKVVPVTGKAVDGAHVPKALRHSGEKRTGEGGGFKEFDDREDDRRKRRAMEERAMVAERKAEKKKCEFWCAGLPSSRPLTGPCTQCFPFSRCSKRASCIC